MSGRLARIWVVTELYKPSNTSTAHILAQVVEFLSEKFEVYVIAGEAASYKYGLPELEMKSHDSNIMYLKSPFVRNHILRVIFGFYFSIIVSIKLKRLLQPDDRILAVTNPQTLLMVMPWFFSSKLTFLIHDVFPDNLVKTSSGLSKYLGKLLTPFYGFAYKRLSSAIVLGDDMEKVIKEKGVKDVQIIRNWADENIELQPYPKGKIKILYAGNVGPMQALKDFLEWFKRLDSELFEFIIKGEGSERAHLQEYVKVNKMKNVYFEGAYMRTEQSDILGQAHFCLVSLNESMFGLGVPSKFYNILKAGRPTLYFGPIGTEIHNCVIKEKVGLVVQSEAKPQAFEKEMFRLITETSPEHYRAFYDNNFSEKQAKTRFLEYFITND
ncbi:MAG: glycosyltransferase family 4 protein [Sphingobacteriaceae bacterium]|nr:glycosyltransferase family 4 protein [Sphingobacteriaceae bacterium]